jgi:hypothetical protein
MRLYLYIFIHSFIHQRLYCLLLGPRLFFSFIIFFTQTVGLLGGVISPLQGLCIHTGQYKHKINAYTDIHAFSEIRTHDPSFRASCLRSRGQHDRQYLFICNLIIKRLLSRGAHTVFYNCAPQGHYKHCLDYFS